MRTGLSPGSVTKISYSPIVFPLGQPHCHASKSQLVSRWLRCGSHSSMIAVTKLPPAERKALAVFGVFRPQQKPPASWPGNLCQEWCKIPVRRQVARKHDAGHIEQ
jgi:hypothetical protein